MLTAGRPPADRPLADRWPLPAGHDVRDALLAAYGEPDRGYHDLRHLTEVLDRLEELSAHEPPPVTVLLAAWFHDGVYDGLPGAESRSAGWAVEALTGLLPSGEVEEVRRLVLLTQRHDPDDGDPAGCLLSDADLAILAAGPDRYDAYVRDVRREYAHVAEDAFRAGRAEVLRAIAAQERIFRTPRAREWEDVARRNLARELEQLSAQGPVG